MILLWVELDGWTAKLRFSACHLIPHHPKCGRLHGHTYAVSVKIHGERTREQEFVIDFERLKGLVAEICARLDHRVVIAENDLRLRITEDGDNTAIAIGEKIYGIPTCDIAFLPTDSTSAESLSLYFASELASLIDSGASGGISKIEVRIDEGLGQGAGCALEAKRAGEWMEADT